MEKPTLPVHGPQWRTSSPPLPCGRCWPRALRRRDVPGADAEGGFRPCSAERPGPDGPALAVNSAARSPLTRLCIRLPGWFQNIFIPSPKARGVPRGVTRRPAPSSRQRGPFPATVDSPVTSV